MAVHTFASAEVAAAVRIDVEVKDGDVLIVPSEQIVALACCRTFAVTANERKMGTLRWTGSSRNQKRCWTLLKAYTVPWPRPSISVTGRGQNVNASPQMHPRLKYQWHRTTNAGCPKSVKPNNYYLAPKSHLYCVSAGRRCSTAGRDPHQVDQKPMLNTTIALPRRRRPAPARELLHQLPATVSPQAARIALPSAAGGQQQAVQLRRSSPV
jgi:hypothetical protein